MPDSLKIIVIVLGAFTIAILSVSDDVKTEDTKAAECKCDDKSKINASGSWLGTFKK